MRTRLLLLLGCVVGLVSGARFVVAVVTPKHQISEQNIERIRLGMTETDVIQILGLAAGNHAGHGVSAVYAMNHGETIPFADSKEWLADDIAVRIRFNDDGRVVWKRQGQVFRSSSFLWKLRRWLGS